MYVDGDIIKSMTSKIQKFTAKKNINNQQQLRDALRPYGIAEATARWIWLNGVTTRHHYAAVATLEKILGVPADQFLEDPENLLPQSEQKGK